MEPKLVLLLTSGDKGQFRIQYDEVNGDLYINDKKVAYEIKLTKWQKILAAGMSVASSSLKPAKAHAASSLEIAPFAKTSSNQSVSLSIPSSCMFTLLFSSLI